jgi:putative membrane protein
MKEQGIAVRFVVRWLVSALGLWVASTLLSSHGMALGVGGTKTWVAALIAGAVLALVNMFVKPLLIFLSIPALLVTLGLFMLVVNGLTIMIVSWLYSSLVVPNFGVAVVAGVIVGLVNFLVSKILEDIK